MSGYWFIFLVAMVAGCSGSRPSQIGVTGGRLSACPDSPNCVSSQSSDKMYAIEPLRYEGSAESALQRLINAVQGMKRARVVTVDGRYVHAEFTSFLFRFVDDAEFLLDEGAKTIHVRSASRIGSSDLGVNRKRVEAIRSRFDAIRREGR
ncbi:MAG: DUF1499 domain-containing protein [Syntrophales bacterium]|nr:DUF1499 domain-containing protein [Syntrophales bacterium]